MGTGKRKFALSRIHSKEASAPRDFKLHASSFILHRASKLTTTKSQASISSVVVVRDHVANMLANPTRIFQAQAMRLATRSLATTNQTKPADQIVYESPLGRVVSRLRAVSLSTAIIGSVGLPVVVSLQGTMPSSGLLIGSMFFVTGTLGSTAAIHFVFRPYVYEIHKIPVRECSTPGVDCVNKDFLYKAITKNLFLRTHETVFDAATDLEAYKGMRPLCNWSAKGQPLYVHGEYVYDEKLREYLPKSTTFVPEKDNPDDFL